MPVKTITAEIDGQTRKITADIPDGASQDDIMSAVEDYVKANPAPKERHGATGSWSGFDAFLNKTGIAPQAGKAVPDSRARVTKDTPIEGGPVVFGGDIPGVIAAVRAAGSLKPLIRPAIGLVSGFGTYAAVDKAAAALNVPPLLREILATAAATAVGGKAGMPEEMQAKLKSGGLKGLLNTWLNGEPKPNDVAEFYKEKYGKLPAPGAETIKAKAEAAEFKRQLAQQLKQAADKPESVKLTPEVKAKSEERAGKVPWRNFPSTAAPEPEAPPIKPATETPSGRKPGGAANQPPNPPRNPAWRNFPSTQPTEKPPADIGIKPTGPRTPRPGTTTIPGATAPVDASKVKEAAELARSLGATPESLKSAPQSQWDGIAKQVEMKADDQFKKAVLEHMGAGEEKPPAPSPKGKLSEPKTPKPTPGGARVESTMTPEARAARADEHATKLAAALRKLPSSDRIPDAGNDSAWKLLEDQTGTEATPEVRKAAIDKALKLWTTGPKSQGDLMKRRESWNPRGESKKP